MSQTQCVSNEVTSSPEPAQVAAERGYGERIRELGSRGRKQWEDAFTRTRELRQRAALALIGAQGRGAGLLLRVVGHVREQAQALEQTLASSRAQAQARLEAARAAAPAMPAEPPAAVTPTAVPATA